MPFVLRRYQYQVMKRITYSYFRTTWLITSREYTNVRHLYGLRFCYNFLWEKTSTENDALKEISALSQHQTHVIDEFP